MKRSSSFNTNFVSTEDTQQNSSSNGCISREIRSVSEFSSVLTSEEHENVVLEPSQKRDLSDRGLKRASSEIGSDSDLSEEEEVRQVKISKSIDTIERMPLNVVALDAAAVTRTGTTENEEEERSKRLNPHMRTNRMSNYHKISHITITSRV